MTNNFHFQESEVKILDVDFRAARIHSAKHIPAVQRPARLNNSGNHGVMEDEGDDEVRAWFPCPFCYVEIEVPVLCVHLQEEHCFDLKNAVCPICAANLGKDPIDHFTVQHAHSIKRRKKSQKSGFWSNISTNIVKDLRELSLFLGTSSLTGSSESAPDPLFSPFLCTVPLSVLKDSLKEMISPCVAAASDAPSSNRSLPDEVNGKNYEERRQRAAFLQELLVSTIL